MIKQNKKFARASRFFVHFSISLPSLHDYDLKMPNFTFYGGRKHEGRIFLSLSKLKWFPKKSAPGFDIFGELE